MIVTYLGYQGIRIVLVTLWYFCTFFKINRCIFMKKFCRYLINNLLFLLEGLVQVADGKYVQYC